MSVLALAILLSAAPAGASSAKKNPSLDFVAGEAAKLTADGSTLKRKLIAPAGPGTWLAVYVFSDPTGSFDRLKVWHARGREVHLCYVETSSSQRIKLDRVHDRGKLPKLYGDGLPTLAYSTEALGTGALHLVRFSGHIPAPETAPLPEGRLEDVGGDGRLEVVTRSLPLGSLFDVECGGFHTMSRAAYRTSIYAFQDGKLVNASSRFPQWYDGHIADLEAKLASMDPHAMETTGEYLNAALSLYFDHAERGRPRQGWSRFNELFRPGPSDSAMVAGCIDQIRGELRRRLNVPDSWQ